MTHSPGCQQLTSVCIYIYIYIYIYTLVRNDTFPWVSTTHKCVCVYIYIHLWEMTHSPGCQQLTSIYILVSCWHPGECVVLEILHSVRSFEVCDHDGDISCNVTILRDQARAGSSHLFSTYMSTVRFLKCILWVQCLDIPECHKKFIYFGLRDSSAMFLSHDSHSSVDYCCWLGPGCDHRGTGLVSRFKICSRKTWRREKRRSGQGWLTVTRPH